jgi:UDP-N-acetylmuramoyl-L-alanyl-D-glutamate--2,6-diaminopimelate ligase
LAHSGRNLEDLFWEAGLPAPAGCGDVRVTGVTDNSQKVLPGNIFVATHGGRTDSHLFISDAVEAGAAVIIAEREIPEYRNTVTLCVDDSRDALGRLAHSFAGNPSRDMLVFGVSGTNGKTTTTYLLESILKAAGFNPGVVGTIEYRYAGRVVKAVHTTPSALHLAEFFAEMRAAGVNAVAMEVSSHAVDQRRISGIEFDIGVLTNITQDHLDYHKTMEAYAAAKHAFYFDFLLRPKMGRKRPAPAAVFNVDDDWSARFADEFPGRKLTFGVGQRADVRVEEAGFEPAGTSIRANCSGAPLDLQSRLLGTFNVSNVLGAVAAGMAADVSANEIAAGISNLEKVPGRFEQVYVGQEFFVLVDYAHTPDALERVLVNARTMTKGRIITVFGCGGDRDKGKRPIMGRIAGDRSDIAILTNDNPRTESPEAIATMVMAGLEQSSITRQNVEMILDRRAAIGRAVDLAQKGDLVMIAGKGHEDYQILGHETIHFDDREVAREFLLSTPRA